MKQEYAKKYAEAMQENIGNKWTTYTAKDTPEYFTGTEDTWSVVIITDMPEYEYHTETKIPREQDLIAYLIGYAGRAVRDYNKAMEFE